MQHDTRILRALADEYRLQLGGVWFWTPYWINRPGSIAHNDTPYIHGPFKGKGTPKQLLSVLERLLADSGKRLATPVAYRAFMRSHGLGIDCSGFAYHLLNGWLQTRQQESLAQHLVVSRNDVLKTMQDKPRWRRRGVSIAEVRTWPSLVSMQQMCKRFRKSPRMLAGVAALVHPTVVVPISKVQDILPGDLIKMTSPRWGDHIIVVIENTGKWLVVAESTEPAGKLGGVTYSRISIISPEKGLEYQQWDRLDLYHPGVGNDGVWRLRGIS